AGKPFFQELHQVVHLLLGEVQFKDFLVQLVVGGAASVVVFHHVVQRLEAAIVHVGSGAGNLTQSGGLERTAIAQQLAVSLAADIRFVGIHSYADIVETAVGEIR